MMTTNNNQGRGTQAASLTVKVIRGAAVAPMDSWSIFSKTQGMVYAGPILNALQTAQEWWAEIFLNVKEGGPDEVPSAVMDLLYSWFYDRYNSPLMYPEIFCSPRIQALLACFFAVVSQERAVEITTTSEVMIRTLQVLVAKGKIDSQKTGLLESETGRILSIRSDGMMDEDFAPGFMDATVELTFALLKAQK